MKPRASLDIFYSQSPLLDLKPSRSRTELSTPDFPQVQSPDFPSPSPEPLKVSKPFQGSYSRTNTYMISSPSSEKVLKSRQTKRKLTSNDSKFDFFPDEGTTLSQSPNKPVSDTSEMLLTARASLYAIRKEARSVFQSSRKTLQEFQKSRRPSAADEDLSSSLPFYCNEVDAPIRELVENINSIKNRILINELTNEIHLKEQTLLKDTVRVMEEKLDKDQGSKKCICVGCVNKCIVI